MGTNVLRAIVITWLAILGATCTWRSAFGDEEANRHFETDVRPLLIEHCSGCHGAKKQSGGLRVDSREALIRGGDSGAALVPGDTAASLMLQAVRRQGDLEMPPDEKLTQRQIQALAQWIHSGAPWPDTARLVNDQESAPADHWAFKPVVRPAVPEVGDGQWVKTPIDAFVLRRLEQAKLTPSPAADRRTLIRRLSYSLTGLPPSADQVRRFVDDPDPQAYEHLVQRLLDSPHYGEQWARHWLDIARYSDTKGYVYDREERFWVHAWTYRDWVVRSLNQDLPYDRFLLLQVAADQVPDATPADMAAMGFLTLGRRFLGVKHDIIDDRIDVVCRGTMALTVGCARCHDHKYDPIPTADYYSLYGVFDSCHERLVPLTDLSPDDESPGLQELRAKQQKLRAQMAAHRTESAAAVRARVADYLKAQTELHKFPAEGFDQIFQKSDLLPAFVRHWEQYLRESKRRDDPVFVAWHAYAQLDEDSFSQRAADVTEQLQRLDPAAINPLVAQAFVRSPDTFQQVIDAYAAVLAGVESQWQAAVEQAAKTGEPEPAALPDPAAEQLRLVLYGPGSPCEVPDESIVHVETFFDTGTCTELWKLQGELDRAIIALGRAAPFALTLGDRPVATEPRIFRRGNPVNKGDEVPRRFPSVLSGVAAQTFQHGSGRLELARAVIDPLNPLTARVVVNRVWTQHFGQGLVTTPSDFGTRADPPSHPELLDYLASRFVEEGWSLKKLHRWIVLSATFRQSSNGPLDNDARQRALTSDPDNRLLWRMNPRRLSFEEFRDSLLAVSGKLDLRVGGMAVDLFKQPLPRRRTLYGLVDRQFLPGTLRMFDFANPDLHIPQRSETTVPQQALFFLNHPIVLREVKALAAATQSCTDQPERIRQLCLRTLQREPTEQEMADCLELVHSVDAIATPAPPPTSADWQYGYGTVDEQADRVTGFTPLPHFTGKAWQGGPNWPDANLGWVQLTAEGGHPGNDRQHAAIRRWTAPRPTTLTIRSRLIHDAAPGDGIRAFIVSSRDGTLQATTAHQRTAEMNVVSLVVQAGDTIDFVVDIGEVLNSDQYLWPVTIEEVAGPNASIAWDSKADFSPAAAQRLSAWQQLAQVLLCTNEFLFVD